MNREPMRAESEPNRSEAWVVRLLLSPVRHCHHCLDTSFGSRLDWLVGFNCINPCSCHSSLAFPGLSVLGCSMASASASPWMCWGSGGG